MIPIVTPAEMSELDAAASESVEVLIDRAGRAVARAALAMMGGAYGRRVLIVAGPGNNGADGRSAASHLRRRGVRPELIGPADPLPPRRAFDLAIDAAFGTGLSRPYVFPAIPGDLPVLAVDIASGVDGLSGELLGSPARAAATVSFAALKPGLLLEPGRSFCGKVTVADIGLDLGAAAGDAPAGSPERADVAAVLPRRAADAHKWRSALRVLGGSASMQGAASLAATAALRCGAGLVQLATPGSADAPGQSPPSPLEAVGHPLPAQCWGQEAVSGSERLQAILAGPGLGPSEPSVIADLGVVCALDLPLVLDGDALQPEILDVVAARRAPTVLTPHEGEWRRIGGSQHPDRLNATRRFAQTAGAVVVRKGPTTVVAAPDGRVRVVAGGSPVLATAGTGDVLAGAIAGLVAQGTAVFDAAWATAWLHAAAGNAGGPGTLASELPALLAALLAELAAETADVFSPPAAISEPLRCAARPAADLSLDGSSRCASSSDAGSAGPRASRSACSEGA